MLHIHNGRSTAGTLEKIGFPGEHFAFNEVLISGPTPEGLPADEWLSLRAGYLADEYQLDLEDCERGLAKQEQTLRDSANHDEVILWFEHDLFCQINLIFLLNWFSIRPSRANLSLICIGEFPGIENFRGLGQLSGEQLASLFDMRHELTGREMSTAVRAWAAYCSSDPAGLERLLSEDTSAMPYLKQALVLHLSRFPSTVNGLGSIANLALALIAGGSTSFKTLFPSFNEREPGFGLGDWQVWSEIRRLVMAKRPLISIGGLGDLARDYQASRFHEATFELTDAGREVLAGNCDFAELNGIDLWLGGVHLVGRAPWRWDEQRMILVHDA